MIEASQRNGNEEARANTNGRQATQRATPQGAPVTTGRPH